jgi:hypothetical protein
LDSQVPDAPIILGASGEDGRAQIRFAPAEPAARTAQVALVRADSASEAGLVIGTPVSAGSGTMTDAWVRSGQVYWYRLVAFDGAGNRGKESAAIEVRVRAPTLEAPAPPKAQYLKDPTPEVRFTFAAPPPHVRALLEVQREDGGWSKVMGPLAGTEAVDYAPIPARPTYRLVYVSEGGGLGVASAPLTVQMRD